MVTTMSTPSVMRAMRRGYNPRVVRLLIFRDWLETRVVTARQTWLWSTGTEYLATNYGCSKCHEFLLPQELHCCSELSRRRPASQPASLVESTFHISKTVLPFFFFDPHSLPQTQPFQEGKGAKNGDAVHSAVSLCATDPRHGSRMGGIAYGEEATNGKGTSHLFAIEKQQEENDKKDCRNLGPATVDP